MERLRIELGGERLDFLPFDYEPPGAESLADGKVLEISHIHGVPLSIGRYDIIRRYETARPFRSLEV
jgi:hypothetical protein